MLMGGGGGGGGRSIFSGRTAEELKGLVRKAEEHSLDESFTRELSRTVGDALADFNNRDVDLVRERLDAAKSALESEIGGSIDQLFGGSVAKHTYVDGLSDIDSLLIINDTEGVGKSAASILRRMERILRRSLKDSDSVEHGRMAVTVRYGDGMQIQLLPAVKGADGKLRVPSSRHDGWSSIDPDAFQKALTRANEDSGYKLIPTVKLAKAIIGSLPESQRLSGYHVESLAIAAFKNYKGEKTTAAMLPEFFNRARDLVLSPIRDRSGQSVHVDGYLGPANSEDRLAASHLLSRFAKRLRNATAAGSTAQWRAILGVDE